MKENVSGCFFLNTVYNAFIQVLVKIINKNLFNKVMSFCLRFVTKRDLTVNRLNSKKVKQK